MTGYCEEIAMSAREYAPRRLVTKCSLRPPREDGSRRLQEPCGRAAAPHGLFDMRNTGDLSQLAHVAP